VRPSEACGNVLRNDRGAWSAELTPMMVEPLDLLGSRLYRGIVFVGPARTGKTFTLILGGIAYIVTCAPGDTLITQMSQDTARDFSRTEVDRVIRHSPDLAAALSPRARDDNTYDKFWRSGMVLKLGWPAVTQVSSKTLQYAFLTDYDRPENRDDVDGEGPLWDLVFKRIETYMSRGKCLAESSPDAEMTQARWKRSSPHEAPPARGITELFNRGTRARWYWPCLHCGTRFEAEPGLGNFSVPEFEILEKSVLTSDLASLAEEYARVTCKTCGGQLEQAQRREMNARASWLHEGESFGADGTIVGTRRRTDIASYWLGGAAAAYQQWASIVFKYLQAVRTYVTTGDESSLKFTTNTDQGAVYLPRVIAKRKGAEHLQARAESWPQGLVPKDVRFLTAAVDVQAGRFVVQVHGWGVALEAWLVDRFTISASRRPEGARFAALDPASFLEDWSVLVEEVIERRYPVVGLKDMRLPIQLTLVDSGGRAGVTGNAYEFWRKIRNKSMGGRLMLVKGSGHESTPRCSMTYPDARDRTDRETGGRGDVPLWLINTNVMKDIVAGSLGRDAPGPGFLHLPDWLPADVFEEFVSETRGDKGRWTRAQGIRNEAFDLAVYNRAAVIALKAEQIDWRAPPTWARPADDQAVLQSGQSPQPAAPRGRRMRDSGIR
jgi:phage terminase large subunit GpA-like protein